jgi:hypothetical protein
VYEKSEECCPKCGLINDKKKRELKTVQGIAVKDERSLDDFLNMHQGAKVKEQKDCKTLEEHWQFKERKGYKDFWVKHIFEAKVLKEYYDENQKIYEKYPVSFSLFGDDEENENKLEQYKLEEELIIKLNKKYGLNVSIDRSETIQEQIINAIDKAWNSFYGLKKLNMKKSYKKSY